MSAQATCRSTEFAGLPAFELALPQGDRLQVSLHGAHVLSWVSSGQERLYLSPQSPFDGQSAIRGGVPVCFPQFNQRGPLAEQLPKHGFVRNVAWQADTPHLTTDSARLALRLSDNEITRRWWPQAFEAQLQMDLQPGTLRMTLAVHNTDSQPLSFSGALHTYFAVPDVTQATLHGLAGQTEWDSLTNTFATAPETLRFAAEFDRVYSAPDNAANPAKTTRLTLNQSLRISQSASWANTVVWNPAQDLCRRLVDMPDDGWRHMLCVEAAQVFEPIQVPPNGHWAGWQQLQVLDR